MDVRSQQPSVGAAWQLLGVSPDADSAQLTRAYRRLARRLHPDVSGEPDATERFSALQAAYHLALEALRRDDPPATAAPTVAPAPRRHPRPHVPWLVAGPVRVQPPRPHPDGVPNPPERHG